jgi:hypothetical protein
MQFRTSLIIVKEYAVFFYESSNLSRVEGFQELLGSSGRGTTLLLNLLDLTSSNLLGLDELSTTEDLSVRVKTVHDTLVLKRVLLLSVRTLVVLVTGRADNRLDFIRVDETSDIRVGHDVSRQDIILLQGSGSLIGTIELIQKSNSGLSPDDETTEMSTRSQLQEVKTTNVNKFKTGQVTESLDETVVFVVDNERTTTLSVTTVTELTLTGTELARVGDLDDISVGVDRLQESNSFLGLGQLLNRVSNDKRNFLDLLNTVTTGHDQRGKSRSGQSGSSGETLLVQVGLDVPLSPGLGRSEHTTATTHVTESGLTSTVSTGTVDTRNTSNSTTSTPRFGRGLLTSLGRNGIRLTLVLGHVGVDKVDNVRTNGGLEDGRKRDGGSDVLTAFGVDVENRSGSGLESYRRVSISLKDPLHRETSNNGVIFFMSSFKVNVYSLICSSIHLSIHQISAVLLIDRSLIVVFLDS